MCSSSGNFSQAAAQRLQASAQDSQIRAANGPLRETICAAATQKSAQSWQVASVSRCSLCPSASR